MKFIRKLLGFDSPYSWMKWLRMSFVAVALIITLAFGGYAVAMVVNAGIIGIIFAIILFAIIFGPTMLVMLGIASLIGMIIGGIQSGIKQRKSFQETEATGSAELMAVEKLRVKSQLLSFLFIIAVIALLVLGFFVIEPLFDAFGEAGFYGYLILAGVALVSFLLAIVLPAKMRYRNAFKETVVKKDLESVFDNVDFRPNEKLDETIVKGTALFGYYDIYSGNDYLSADYHGHHFLQSDIHLLEEKEETYTDDDGDSHTRTVYVTIFRGRLMVFDYDAISNEPVAVHDRARKKPKNSEAIQTELDAFNRQFSIIAPSPAAALRILTPPVLEGIVLARGKLGYPLFLSFKDDKLYVALANGDAFEAAGGDATLSEQRKRVTDEITAMLALVDTLYLKK